MVRKRRETCCVGGHSGCKASARSVVFGRLATCYACGLEVCTSPGCSIVTTRYYPNLTRGKRVRVCFGCAEDHQLPWLWRIMLAARYAHEGDEARAEDERKLAAQAWEWDKVGRTRTGRRSC